MTTAAPNSAPTIALIAVDQIALSPLNPRKRINPVKLEELISSICKHGVRTPLQVRPAVSGKKKFEIIAGERRYRAALAADLELVPCIVTPCSDDELVELALTENNQREDLTPMDEARSYQAAMKANPKQYTVAYVAAVVSKSESHVYRKLKLLDLDAPLQVALDEDRLSIQHAEKLMRLPVKLQREAVGTAGSGVVWRRNPLLEYGQKWVPTKDDLAPLHELERFIRQRSHFDPASRDTRYLQPELVEQLEASVAQDIGEAPTTDAIADTNDELADTLDAELASLIELSLDPMVRMRMRAGRADKVPLPPSQWKKVAGLDACNWARRGAVTHGGEARLLIVCIGKGKCTKHWPAKAKSVSRTKAAPSSTAVPTGPTPAERKAKREAAVWEALTPKARSLTVTAAASAKRLTAALVEFVSRTDFINQPRDVQEAFGVSLTDATAVQVLVLAAVSEYGFNSIDRFEADVAKRLGFSTKELRGEFDREVKALEAAEKATAKTGKRSTGAELGKLSALERTVIHAVEHSRKGSLDDIRAVVASGSSNAELDRRIHETLGTGGRITDDYDYRTQSGQLIISRPVRKKLTVGEVRDILRRLLTPTQAEVMPSKKGKKTASTRKAAKR